MATQAQNKATANYRKKNVRQVVVRFYPKDSELYEFVKDRGGSAYMKRLAALAMSAERHDDGPLAL